MKQRLKQFTAAVMAVALLVFQVPTNEMGGNGNEMTKAFAADVPAYNINLGTGVLQTGEGDKWSTAEGDTVWFGYDLYTSGGMTYRILENDGRTMLLDCEKTFEHQLLLNVEYSGFDAWEDTYLRTTMNSQISEAARLYDEEAALLCDTVHTDERFTQEYSGESCNYYSNGCTDTAFLLSAEEAVTYYADAASRVKDSGYWLRSNVSATGTLSECHNVYVNESGELTPCEQTEGYGVSPAFRMNADRSSILFTSALNAKGDGLKQPQKLTNNHEWVLTVLGDDTVTLQNGELVAQRDPEASTEENAEDEAWTLAWEADATATYDTDSNYSYAILITDEEYTDENAKIKWYGFVKEHGYYETSDYVSFEIPEDYTPTDHVYIIAEKKLASKNTTEGWVAQSYCATAPLEIDTGICQVTVDSTDSNMTTKAEESQLCYPGTGYQESFEAVYTVKDGYYIPEDYSVPEQSGIQVTRLSSTQVKVSGTPEEAIVNIELPAAKKPVLTIENPADSHLVWDSTSGKETQEVAAGKKVTDIVYTVEDGYYIPESYAITAESEVKVIRESRDTLRIQAPALTKDTTIELLPATVFTAGTATVTMADYYYGGTVPTPQLQSETNSLEGAVLEYKKADEPDTAYTTAAPTQVGTYTLRATLPANATYDKAVAVTEFSIRYLPTPEAPYTVSGTKGKNNYYTSNVVVTPAEGYLIADAQDGEYKETLVLQKSAENSKVYLKKQETGEQTGGIALDILIDKDAPVLSVKDGETYYSDSYEVMIQDENLSKVVVNDTEKDTEKGTDVIIRGSQMKVYLSANRKIMKWKITATDAAGNQTQATITVKAAWMEKRVVLSGEWLTMYSDEAYSLEDGIWQVSGDSTSYSGGRTFYVKQDGEYEFTKTD